MRPALYLRLGEGKAAVLVFPGECDISGKPVRRGEGHGRFLGGKLHLGQHETLIKAGKDIQLNGKPAGLMGNPVAFFCENAAVRLFEQMSVGFFCEGEVVLLPFQEPL